jgi:hypothetical protein
MSTKRDIVYDRSGARLIGCEVIGDCPGHRQRAGDLVATQGTGKGVRARLTPDPPVPENLFEAFVLNVRLLAVPLSGALLNPNESVVLGVQGPGTSAMLPFRLAVPLIAPLSSVTSNSSVPVWFSLLVHGGGPGKVINSVPLN